MLVTFFNKKIQKSQYNVPGYCIVLYVCLLGYVYVNAPGYQGEAILISLGMIHKHPKSQTLLGLCQSPPVRISPFASQYGEW